MQRLPTHPWMILALCTALSACGGSSNPPAGSTIGTGGGGVPLACAVPLPAPDLVQQATEVPCSQRADERVLAMSDAGIGLMSELGLPKGRYALPATEQPTQLVVMFHGHQNDSCS